MDNERRATWSWPALAGCLALAYIVPLLVIAVDELVLRTFIVSSYVLEYVGDAFEVAYWPILKLLGVR